MVKKTRTQLQSPKEKNYDIKRVYVKVTDDIDLSVAEKIEPKNGGETFYRMPDGKIYVISHSGQIYERKSMGQDWDTFRNQWINSKRYGAGYQ